MSLKTVRHNAHQGLIAIDQLFNVLFCSIVLPKEKSWADETLSSRAWRWHIQNKRHWPCKVIDTLFFFDRDAASGKRHCEMSFESERHDRHQPPEVRGENN